nr:hypothetical protein [uncultured Comamonas sp.]
MIYQVFQLARKRLSGHDPRETIVLLALMSLLVFPALVVRFAMDATTEYRNGSLGNVMATLVAALISAGIALALVRRSSGMGETAHNRTSE